MTKSTYLSVSAGLIFLVSCGSPPEEHQAPVGERISFAKIHQSILKPSCLGCHGNSQQPLLRDYNEVKSHLAAIQRTVIVNRTMPKGGPLPDDQISLLEKWIADGAPEIPEEKLATGTSERALVAWTELQEKVIKPKCLACHFTKNPNRLSDLSDPKTFHSLVGAILYIAVAKSTMPPPPTGTPVGAANPNQLTRPEKDLLAHWVVDGMKP